MRTNRITFALAFLAVGALIVSAFSSPDVAAALLAAVAGKSGLLLAWGPLVRQLESQHAAEVDSLQKLAGVLGERDFSAEEDAQYQAHKANAAALKARIERAKEAEAASAGVTITEPAAAAPAPVRGVGAVNVPAQAVVQVSERVDNDPQRGFNSMGDYLMAVYGAAVQVRRGMAADQRLSALSGGFGAALPSNYGNTNDGEAGGYLVPPGFSSTIMRLSLEEDALLPLTDTMNITGNSMTLPKDETTPWGSDGVRAYWEGEGDTATATKPKIQRENYRLKKLFALVPMTEELLADGVALAAYFEPAAARSIRWKTDEAILFGSGGENPLGAFVDAGAVTVSKDAGQAAATLTINNVVNMMARMPGSSYGRARWLINNDVLPQLITMRNGTEPVWTSESGGIHDSPFGLLLGRPVMLTQHAKTLGTAGDIMLADFSMYRSMTKAGGIQTATSMHLYFDADATAFRATFRVDGKPKLTSAITPANGSNTLSPFVRLETRS